MPRRRTGPDLLVVVLSQGVGLVVAFFATWWAYFALPADGLFGEENDLGTRLGGALAAVLFAAGLPAGLWAGAVLWRSRLAVVGASAVGVVSLAGWTAWALQLG